PVLGDGPPQAPSASTQPAIQGVDLLMASLAPYETAAPSVRYTSRQRRRPPSTMSGLLPISSADAVQQPAGVVHARRSRRSLRDVRGAGVEGRARRPRVSERALVRGVAVTSSPARNRAARCGGARRARG